MKNKKNVYKIYILFGINMEYKYMPPRSYCQNKRLSFSHLFFFKNTFFIKYSPTETVIVKYFLPRSSISDVSSLLWIA